MKLLLAGLLMFTVSCASFKAERVSNKDSDDKAMEITDKWVVEDSRRAIDEVLKQMANHKNFKRVMKNFRGQPKVFIAEVQNNTSEAYFPIGDLNEEFLYEVSAAGDFQLVDNQAREAILKEITYQNDGMVAADQAKQIGKQLGADFLIFGSVNMDRKKRDGKTLKEYTVNMRLTNLETAGEVCRMRTRINKFSNQKSYGW